ncbi:hypothetical protein Kpol_1070p25, partial [Vanderwaltozyma polyspora DSM 70294]
PATIPARPVGDLKWATAASQGMDKEKRNSPSSAVKIDPTVNANVTSTLPSANSTPRTSTPVLSNPTLSQQLERAGSLTSPATTPTTVNSLLNKPVGKLNTPVHQLANVTAPLEVNNSSLNDESVESISRNLPVDDYESDITDDDLETTMPIENITSEEIEKRSQRIESLRNCFNDKIEIIGLPCGIQQYLMGKVLHDTKLYQLDGKLGGYRRSCDTCYSPSIDILPVGANPPTSVDAFRSCHQWDSISSSLREVLLEDNTNEDKLRLVLERFRPTEIFTLFYHYYFPLTPLQKQISSILLIERDWKLLKNGTMWFLKQGEPKFSNESFEVGNYKIFKADDWTVIEKFNFKLDFNSLMYPPSHVSSTDDIQQSQKQNSENEMLSHGKQLLQQLNRGKIGLTA